MIIDFHTHIFSPDVLKEREQYCKDDACFGLLYSNPKARVLAAEDLVRNMDEKHVKRSVVLNIGWTSHEMCRRSNDYILEAAAKYPSRLTAFCSVQPLESEKALAEIERCCKAGARGIGELRPDLQGFDPDSDSDELLGLLVNKLIEHDMMISFHASEPVGHEYAGKGEMKPGMMYKFIKSHPGLKVVLAHFGGGLAFYEAMPEVSEVLRNTYYDTAAAPFLYSPSIYRALVSIMGSSKILFGSDWPLLDPQRVSGHVSQSELGQADLANILFANAAKLLGI